MPAPAIIGLAALGGLIGKIVEKAIDFFLSKVGKRIAIITVVIAGLYAAIGVLFAIVGSQLDPLIAALPQSVTGVMGAALPSNTAACLAAIVATEIACITYSLTIKALDLQTRIV